MIPQKGLESSLLYKRVDGSSDFVHDTIKGFLACSRLAGLVNRGAYDLNEAFDLVSRYGPSHKEDFLYCLEPEVIGQRLYGLVHDLDLRGLARFHDFDLVDKGDKVIVCVDGDQCYTNGDAQKPISEIFSHLYDKHGLELLTTEGGAREYQLDVFRKTEDPKIRREVAEYFLNLGQIHGGELFAIMCDNDDIIWGVEDVDTYIGAAKSMGMIPDSPSEIKPNFGAKFGRHGYWADNTVAEALKRDASIVALFFSNTSPNWYKEMCQSFREGGYSSVLITHVGPRGIGENYWKLAKGEPVSPLEAALRKILA